KPRDRPLPPRWADRLLESFCAPHLLEEMQGDLHERFYQRVPTVGEGRARWRYAWEVLGFLRPFAWRRDRKIYPRNQHNKMFKNYFIVATRSLLRYKVYSFINVLGLSVGIVCCLLIYLFVRDELSYDRYHAFGDRIHRVVTSTAEDRLPTNANGSFPIGPALQKDFPEVASFVRFRKMGQGTRIMVGHGEKRFYEEKFFFADSTVFQVFSFPMRRGNPQKALDEPNTVVITQATAQKYFGVEDPVGKTLVADPYNDGQLLNLKVTGVLENLPAQSHFTFDFLASFATQRDEDLNQWSGFWQVFTYVLLRPETDARTLNRKLEAYTERYMGKDDWYQVSLQPLTEIHLRSSLRSEVEPTSDIQKVYVFSGIGVIILLVACINFMNLATARSMKRAKEVGIRKTLGAYRWQLFLQFISESFLFSLVAAVIALVLLSVALPAFNQLMDTHVALHQLREFSLIGVAAGLIFFIAWVAGSYPAFFLSAFKPKDVLKNSFGSRVSAAGIRKALVVFQFVISTGLIACTILIHQQMQLVRASAMTAGGDQTIVLPVNKEIRGNYEVTKQRLRNVPRVVSVAGSSLVPTKGSNSYGYRTESLPEGNEAFTYLVDHDYVPTMNYKVVAGRNFSTDFPTDTSEAYILNRKAVTTFGFRSPEQAIGAPFGNGAKQGKVIGVVENFHVYSLRDTIEEAVLTLYPNHAFGYLSIRLSPGDLPKTLSAVEQVWNGTSPTYPFEYFFLNESFAQLHHRDIRAGQTLATFAVLAILTACLGLFGLAAFTAEQRTKEIGIRKVLGASVSNLVALLSKDFLKLVLIANLVAWPLAYYAMHRWLHNFAYRIDISWWVFAVAGMAALLIAWLTVGFQAVKAAVANPVKSLRTE
ncbi:MAG: ABC transporter permease, partial [Ferruginibacter sp.]|nr:ABC transporter permease [Cytophagales bacterium]